jgi:hypothetical protein
MHVLLKYYPMLESKMNRLRETDLFLVLDRYVENLIWLFLASSIAECERSTDRTLSSRVGRQMVPLVRSNSTLLRQCTSSG